MKNFLLFLLLIVVSSGCAFMSDEDRDFYGKGWIKPTELDNDMKPRTINDPSRPQSATYPTTSNAGAHAATTPNDPEWLVPETSAPAPRQ